jgi:hypothetical protein
MRIPEVRERLFAIAAETGNDELEHLACALYRRPAVRRADPQSRPMTPELISEIRGYAAKHPRATLSRIAQFHDTNIGRVSEALGGKRT